MAAGAARRRSQLAVLGGEVSNLLKLAEREGALRWLCRFMLNGVAELLSSFPQVLVELPCRGESSSPHWGPLVRSQPDPTGPHFCSASFIIRARDGGRNAFRPLLQVRTPIKTAIATIRYWQQDNAIYIPFYFGNKLVTTSHNTSPIKHPITLTINQGNQMQDTGCLRIHATQLPFSFLFTEY